MIWKYKSATACHINSDRSVICLTFNAFWFLFCTRGTHPIASRPLFPRIRHSHTNPHIKYEIILMAECLFFFFFFSFVILFNFVYFLSFIQVRFPFFGFICCSRQKRKKKKHFFFVISFRFGSNSMLTDWLASSIAGSGVRAQCVILYWAMWLSVRTIFEVYDPKIKVSNRL